MDAEICTMLSRFKCPFGAKAYYELEILEIDVEPLYGFATEDFSPTAFPRGVGRDQRYGQSWSFDSDTATVDIAWKAGDVIGLACDLHMMQIKMSINGYFSKLILNVDPDVVINGLFAAFKRIGFHVAGCHVGGKGQRLGWMPFDPNDTSVATGQLQTVALNQRVILFPDPAA